MKLANYPYHIQRYELMIPNTYIANDSEADLFAIRKSGLSDEFEIKVSRSDFLADKKKTVRVRSMTREEELFKWNNNPHPNTKPKYQALRDGNLPVNYFWYVVAEGIADESEIPDFAGFIIILESGRMIIQKKPVKLHRKKLSFEERYQIARKTNYRFWKLKNETQNMIEKPVIDIITTTINQ